MEHRLRPDSEMSDLEDMDCLQTGDPEALRPLIERWEPRLLSFVYRYTQDTHSTRDIVQEVFVRVYHRRSQFQAKHGFAPWVFTIAANLCRNRARWSKRHPEESWDASSEEGGSSHRERLADPHAGPRETAESEEALTELKSMVMELPHDQKTAVLLHHYEGLATPEIATIVGCSRRGVETRIYRAMKQLKRVGQRKLS